MTGSTCPATSPGTRPIPPAGSRQDVHPNGSPRIPGTGIAADRQLFSRSEPAHDHKSNTPEICKHPSHTKPQKLSYP